MKARARQHALAMMGAFVLAALGLGCGDPDSRKTSKPPDEPATRRAETPPAGGPVRDKRTKPGYFVGRVLGADGNAISAPGAKVTVTLVGVGDAARDHVTVLAEVQPDGTFEKKLPAGTYLKCTGTVDVPFDGRPYRFDLHPVTELHGDVRSSEGIVQDFVWKLTGLRPGNTREDQTKGEIWYGGQIKMVYMAYRADLRTGVPQAPPGTRVILTVTPTSPLADGSKGEPIEFERGWDGSIGLDNAILPNLPLAMVSVRGEEILPDGRRQKLLLLKVQRGRSIWGESVEGTFPPDLDHAKVKGVEILFTRQFGP